MKLNLEEARENYIVFENGDIFDIAKNKFVHQFSVSSGYLTFYCRLLKKYSFTSVYNGNNKSS